jgi:hypothetical protein
MAVTYHLLQRQRTYVPKYPESRDIKGNNTALSFFLEEGMHMLSQTHPTPVIDTDVNCLLTSAGGCSLVLPIRVFDLPCLSGFQEHYQMLIQHMEQCVQQWEILIVDASPDPIFSVIDAWFADIAQVRHFRPHIQDIAGHNNKLLGLRDALPQAQFRYALLLDHDMRPSPDVMREIILRLQDYDCARCMIHYQSFRLAALINVNGIFLVNLLCRDKQFWGHLLLDRRMLLDLGLPRTDTLFDELTIMRHFQHHGKRVGYISTIQIPMAYRDSPAHFIEQRLRYAYENLAYPLRFLFFLSLLPLLLTSLFFSPLITLTLFLVITIGVIGLSWLGQTYYDNGTYPPYTFLYAPLWFWPYPFTSWIALGLRLKGGIAFGGQIIRRPA